MTEGVLKHIDYCLCHLSLFHFHFFYDMLFDLKPKINFKTSALKYDSYFYKCD